VSGTATASLDEDEANGQISSIGEGQARVVHDVNYGSGDSVSTERLGTIFRF